MPNAMTLPPYGFYTQLYARYIEDNPAPPIDFIGATETDRDSNKAQFVNAVILDIGSRFWPEWSRMKCAWEGASVSTMVDLTSCDLRLLADFRPKTNVPIALPFGSLTRIHFFAFETEDSNLPFTEIGYYLHSRPTLTNGFADVFEQAFNHKLNTITLELKSRFMRPRPYQAALLLGVNNLTFLRAVRGDTPSLVSGHCMQGLFGAMAMHLEWLTKSSEYDSTARENFQQYAIDFGDRRVFAGVHYPSDNLITWLICFNLIGKVFSGYEISIASDFLKASIRRSHVWTYVSNLSSKEIGCATYTSLIAAIHAKIA